jgi:hypothetical protein
MASLMLSVNSKNASSMYLRTRSMAAQSWSTLILAYLIAFAAPLVLAYDDHNPIGKVSLPLDALTTS